MIWEEIYRASLLCMGERSDSPIFYEEAVAALNLASNELEEARKAYLYAHALPIFACERVETLNQECHFPSAFFAVLVYGLAAALLRNDDLERAKIFCELKAAQLKELLGDLPAHIHPISDYYG